MAKNFFKHMENKYGIELMKMMKLLYKLKLKLAKAINKKLFLLRCRKQQVCPHNRKLKNLSNINTKIFNKLQQKFLFAVMNQEITETFINIKKINTSIDFHTKKIKSIISPYTFNKFSTNLEIDFKRNFDLVRARHIRKFMKLLQKGNPLSDMKSITVSTNVSDNTTHPPNNTLNKSSQPSPNTSDSNKWLVNLSSIQIPTIVYNVLKLGDKFCPPVPEKSTPFIQIIAGVESILINPDNAISDRPRLRNELVNILTNYRNRSKHKKILTFEERNILKDVALTKKFVKSNPNILITRADKGNVTVVIDKIDYIAKMESMLIDNRIYKIIGKENTTSIQKTLNDMVTVWQRQGRIDEYAGKKLRSYNGVLARFYGLPKIHKENCPYRPIVDATGTPLYNLSLFLSDILNHTIGKSSTAIRNSEDFKSRIRDVVIPEDYVMLSLDVVSLFTNVDSILVLKLISNDWRNIKKNAKVKLLKQQFLEAMKLSLTNCEFIFNDKIYLQLFGSPMGSPISPAVANLVMEFIEQCVLGSLNFQPLFFFRYVDDIVTAIPKDKIDVFLIAFNSFDDNIKFTIELEKNGRLPFLDILIIRGTDGSVSTDWYHKLTWSGRYLNFNSHLPFTYKRNTISILANKILNLSDPIFHTKNFNLLTDTLLSNNYPLSLIKSVIKSSRYKIYTNPNLNRPALTNQFLNRPNYVSIPYVKTLFEQIRPCLKKYNVEVVGRSHNNLRKSVFSQLKDPREVGKIKNIVYKVNCTCNSSYIGQTKQLLKTRIYQHKNDSAKLIKDPSNTNNMSALSAHLAHTGHNIFIDNVEVLEREENLYKRRVLEMIHIKRNHNAINRQSDSEYLQDTYNSLL